jgi:hypothetical protein
MKLSCRFTLRVFALSLLGSVFVLSGCSTIHTEVGRPLPEQASPLVEGTTRAETVVHDLGPPHAVSALPDGFAFLYEYSRVSEFQFGLSLKTVRMPYFKLIKADSNLSEAARILVFDERGVLRAQGSAAWKEKLSGGGALQFIFSVLSLTDTSAFRREPDPLTWGRGNLQRPPVTLNSAQDLRSGINGLQQRVAPVFVGQATLEMTRPKPIKNTRPKGRSLR